MTRADVLVDRLRESGPAREAMHKVFPGHWSFLLGEVALFSFVVLVATGIYLSVFYEASAEPVIYDGAYEPLQGAEVSVAYHSVMDITFEVPAGLVVRQIHHWAALVFTAAVVAHLARVFFSGAFRRPRRLNWMIGVTLLGVAMTQGFFGLVLPHDLLGGTSARIAHAFAVSIPLVGPGVASVLFAGEFANPDMLHRAWQLHVIVLPALLVALLAAHLGLVWLQTHSQFPGRHRDERNVVGAAAWPAYALKAGGLFLVVGSVLLALGAAVQIAPIWIYGPFEVASATVPAQPDWYLGWVEGALRILPGIDVRIGPWEVPSAFFAGVLLMIVVFALLYAWPFIEERVTGDRANHHLLDRPRDRPVRTGIGVGAIAFLGVLHLAGSHDLQGLLLGISVDEMTAAYRILLIVVPPLAGAVAWRICRDLVRSEEEAR